MILLPTYFLNKVSHCSNITSLIKLRYIKKRTLHTFRNLDMSYKRSFPNSKPVKINSWKELEKQTKFILQKFNYSSIDNPLTINNLLTSCEDRLQREEIDEAALNAEYIIAHALGICRADLFKILNQSVNDEQFSIIEKMMHCKFERMPLQYILGDWDFHSVKLKVRPPVFIPRPETEGLVNMCIEILKELEEPVIMDVCCGTGAISLALLNYFPRSVDYWNGRPLETISSPYLIVFKSRLDEYIEMLECVAVDQSRYATELTLENACDLNVSGRLHVIQGKVTDASFPTLPRLEFDLIVSNPPYVLRKDLMNLQAEIIRYEDLRALDGGTHGLDVIKPIILHGYRYLKPGGCLLMEVDPCHRHLLPTWMEKKATAYHGCEFYADYRGVDRYVKLVKQTAH